MAYKVFSNGDALTGGELNTYLMNQSVIQFASTTARDAAIPAPSEGQLVWLQDSNKYVYYTGSAWADLISATATSGNAIINGAFDIWQRGTSFTPSAAWNYNADRFAMYCDGSGHTPVVSRQTFTPGAAPVAGYEGSYFWRYSQAAAGTSNTTNWVAQRIEDVRTFAGQSVTLSFWAKADAARTVTTEFYQEFGSGGSSGVTTTGGTHSLTTSWTRFTVSVSIPSISGKTIGTNPYLTIQFKLPAGVAQTIDIWGIQLEAGSTATAFKRNGTSLAAELNGCERYYRTGTLNFRQYSPTGGSSVYFVSTSLIAGMRTTPTPAFIAAAAASSNITGTPTLIMYDATSLQQTLNATNTGDCYYVRRFELSAEL